MKSQPKRSLSPRPPPATPPRSSPSGFRPRRLLVTTDFSPASLAALPHAAALAEQFGAEVALLHVVESAPSFVGMESLGLLSSGDATIGRGYGELDALAKEAFRPGIRVKPHVRTGRPFQEINRAASELDAGLIVIATHGHTGLKHTLLGSTAERVLRRAPHLRAQALPPPVRPAADVYPPHRVGRHVPPRRVCGFGRHLRRHVH